MKTWSYRLLVLSLVLVICGAPQVMAQVIAPEATPSQEATQDQEPAPAEEPQQETPQGSGSQIDPSQAPLQPIPGSLPEAPSSTPEQNQQEQPRTEVVGPATTPQVQQPTQRTEPLGAAAAERAATAGGAASKPAGTAIAPAKQKQRWSLLLKLGAVVGAGVAIGTVAALSKSSPSSPAK
jgi:hypothetical protein